MVYEEGVRFLWDRVEICVIQVYEPRSTQASDFKHTKMSPGYLVRCRLIATKETAELAAQQLVHIQESLQNRVVLSK
jgi:hypothetical protein